ncbi:MAG: hypothetical protein Q4E57_09545, partial [Eubacteriales bacterium]|nr:hypothetical protein [Eubacteriales bacterium]
MRRSINGIKGSALAVLTVAAAGVMSFSAFAATKYVDLRVNLDEIPEHNAGEAFMPEFELEDTDSNDDISIDFGEKPETTLNPTIPYNYIIKVHSDNNSLDEDLQIRGTGIRTTYVDYVSVDNSDAEGRLQVYPFYRLISPSPVIDKAAKKVTWAEVPYAGQYEYVITYTTKNGDTKTTHGKTKQLYTSVASALSADADGEIGVAVRALATEEEGYEDAVIAGSWATWDDMDWAHQYRIRIQYTNASGNKVKQEYTVEGKTRYNVESFINSAADGVVKVTVRAVPKNNDHAYYNIAVSEFGITGGETVETGDYDVDDPWVFLADYTATVDGNFASNINSGASTGLTGTDSSWKRVTYKWQYL